MQSVAFDAQRCLAGSCCQQVGNDILQGCETARRRGTPLGCEVETRVAIATVASIDGRADTLDATQERGCPVLRLRDGTTVKLRWRRVFNVLGPGVLSIDGVGQSQAKRSSGERASYHGRRLGKGKLIASVGVHVRPASFTYPTSASV